MYCVNCGVKLSASETVCPLCETKVIRHPEIQYDVAEKPYPSNRYPKLELRPSAWIFIATVLVLMVASIVFVCDYKINGSITWAGIVIGALTLIYSCVVLPCWFRKPNPVIFVPIDFAVLGAYLFYLNFLTDGNWFLTLALPIVAALGVITTAVVTLLKYIRKGRFFVFGGGSIALGLMVPLLELLLNVTFGQPIILWSLFPLGVLFLFGMFLIIVAICRPAREALEKKFFF